MGNNTISASKTRTEQLLPEQFYNHIHGRYEIFCFLSGDAEYHIEGTVYPLAPGDLLLIGCSEAHFPVFHSRAAYERIVVHFSLEDLLGTEEELSHIRRMFDSRPMGAENRFPCILQQNPYLHACLDKLVDATGWAKRVYLTTLLHELATLRGCDNPPSPGKKSSTRDMIRYITDHLTQPLSLEQLAGEFYLSKAQLNRSFKKATGSSVWEYIQTKRLLLAKELLRTGRQPTQVSIQCGFGTYSSFYRAYKKHFGISPNEEQA